VFFKCCDAERRGQRGVWPDVIVLRGRALSFAELSTATRHLQ
jgi:hypothetical protein